MYENEKGMKNNGTKAIQAERWMFCKPNNETKKDIIWFNLILSNTLKVSLKKKLL